MKTKITLLLFIVLGAFAVQAQSPQKFNYQAAVRNSAGTPIINKQIGVKISLHETTAAGTVVYEETHTPTTNAFGVFSIQVGTGSVVTGTFSAVTWNSDKHFVEILIDPNGGTTYKTLGTNELISVPYALHANTVENDKVDDADADSTNEIQMITKSGNVVSLSKNGGSYIDNVYDGDSSQSNELQSISKTGNMVSLSNGGGSFTDEVDDADADANNEIQTLSKTGSTISLSKSGGTVSINDADASTTNELQTISSSGSNISLSNGGGTVSINDADASVTNEIQTLSKSGNQVSLSLSGGGFSVADSDSNSTNELQTVSKTGNQVSLSDNGGGFSVADADSSKTNEIQTLSKSGTNLALSNGGGTVPISGLNYWTQSGSSLYKNSSNIGIGTSLPAHVLQVFGSKPDTSLAYLRNSSASNGSHAVKGFVGSLSAPTVGYLGVVSKTGFDNNSTLKFPGGNGMEVGVLGVTTGGNGSDNIAVMGYTNGGWGGYFKNTGSASQVSLATGDYGVYIDTGSFYVQDNAIVNGNLGVSQYIVHTGDINTYLDFKPDEVRVVAGAYEMLKIVESGTTSAIDMAPTNVNVGIGTGYNNVKFSVVSNNTEDNTYGSYVSNTANTNNQTYGSYSRTVTTGAYNQNTSGAYNTSQNGFTGTGTRFSFGSWNTATNTSTTGTSLAYGIYATTTGTASNTEYAGYFGGDIYSTGSLTLSDSNLKTNIAYSTSSLQKIMATPVKSYEYKTQQYAHMNLPEGNQTGIMAQDLEVQFPRLVKKTYQPPMSEDEQKHLVENGQIVPETAKKEVGFKAVNYVGLIPHLTKAIQEQQQIINTQKSQLQNQAATNNQQAEELATLKKELEAQKKLLLELQKLLIK